MAPGELSAPISWGLLLLVGRVGRLVNFLDFVVTSGLVFISALCVFGLRESCVGGTGVG